MKRLATIGLLCFSLLVTACATTAKPTTTEKGGNLFGENSAVVNSDFVSANIYQNSLDTLTTVYDLNHHKSPARLVNSDTIISENYASQGLLITKNNTNHIGFYSLVLNEYILPPQFNDGWVEYNIVNTTYVGPLINIHFEDNYSTFDIFGNRLLTTRYLSHTEKIVNRKAYISLNAGDKIYEYDETAKATLVNEIPTASVMPSTYDGPEQGSIYKEGRYDLDDYGFEGYTLYIANSGLITTYNRDSLVSTFYVDLNTYHVCGIIGNKLIFQRSIQVPQEYELYNYISNGTKYSLETLLVNFMDGKEEKKDASLVINSVIPCRKPSTLKGTYSYVVYQLINENKILTDTVACIIDDEFNIRDNISGHLPENLIKLTNGNYYNSSTGYIYDEKLDIITSIKDSTPVYYRHLKAFVGKYENKYGLIGEDGRIIHEFLYDQIYASDAIKNNVIATVDQVAVRLSLAGNSPEYIGYGINKIDTNLFKTNDGTYFSSDRYLFSVNTSDTVNSFTGQFFSQYKVFYYKVMDNWNNVQTLDCYHSLYYENFSPKMNTFNTGTEIVELEPNGSSMDDAAILKAGYNKLHLVNQNSTSYGKFTAEEEGYYSFYLPYAVEITNDMVDGEAVHYHDEGKTIGSIEYDKRYVMYLKSGSSVVTRFNYNNTNRQTYNLYIQKETGTDSRYPLIIKDTKEHYFSANNTGETTIWVRFTAPELGKYTLLSEGTIKSAIVNDVNVITGKVIGKDNTYLYQINATVSKITNSLTFVKATATAPYRYHAENPYLLEYGNHSGDPVVFTPGSDLHAYLAFKSTYGGYYSFNATFTDYDELETKAYVVSSIGVRNELTSSSFNLEPGGYLLVELTPTTTEEEKAPSVTLYNYSITSSAGRSYENPASFNNYVDNSSSYPYFYQYTNTTPYSNLLFTYSINSGNLAYIRNNKVNYFEENTKLFNLPQNESIIFRLTPNSYISSQSMQYVISNPTEVTNKEGLGEITLNANSIQMYRYTNNSTSSEQIRIYVYNGYNLYFAVGTNKQYFVGDEFSYIGSSSKSYGYYTLQPGESVSFAISNPSTSYAYQPTISFYFV